MRTRTLAIRFATMLALLAGALSLSVVTSSVVAAQPLSGSGGGGSGGGGAGCGGAFQTATVANTTANWTAIDYYWSNGNPNALVIATPVYGPNNVYDNHPIGVWYTGGHWAVFNQDLAPMPIGASFDLLVQWGLDAAAQVTTATSGNSVGDYTLIDNSISNNDPNAVVLVTPTYGPNSVYNNHPIGVWYTGKQWAIFNEDLAAIPLGASFNVAVYATPTSSTFVQQATAANSTGDLTYFSNALSDGNPYINLNATPRWQGVYSNHNIGLYYNASAFGPFAHEWGVFNQDVAPIPLNALYNLSYSCF